MKSNPESPRTTADRQQTTDEQQRFTAREMKISNIQVWNRAVSRCQEIVSQVAADYASVGAEVTARQIRCVSLLLEPERKPEDGG